MTVNLLYLLSIDYSDWSLTNTPYLKASLFLLHLASYSTLDDSGNPPCIFLSHCGSMTFHKIRQRWFSWNINIYDPYKVFSYGWDRATLALIFLMLSLSNGIARKSKIFREKNASEFFYFHNIFQAFILSQNIESLLK